METSTSVGFAPAKGLMFVGRRLRPDLSWFHSLTGKTEKLADRSSSTYGASSACLQRNSCQATSDRKTPGMPTFLSLPPELRRMIYEYVLNMRLKPITPYREYYELRPPKEKPTVGLLGVNKTIGAEAAPVLYSNNLWRVSSTIYTGRGPSSTLQAPRPVRGSKDLALWGSRAELFRHVLLVISSCDVITKSIWDLPYYGVTVDPSYATPGARTYTENQQLAQENLRRMSRAFKFEAIAQMQNLSSIILDVEGLFSSSYGGRRLEQMEKALQDFFHHLESRKVGRNPPLEVSIIGLEEEQEKAILQPFTDRITWAEKGTCWPDGRIFQRTGGTFHY